MPMSLKTLRKMLVSGFGFKGQNCLFRRANRKAASRRSFIIPRLHALEERTTPSTFTVLNTDDSGPDSLRQAILDSNDNPGADTIAFDVAGGGEQTIQPLSALPEITDSVVIDGTTQPGYVGRPLIVLNGTTAGSVANGLTISAGSSTVRGLVINSFRSNGILLQTNGGN